MPGVLDGVNSLTQLAGHNRLELLMFRLGDDQRYGINVFKVQEVIPCPKITPVPQAHKEICGIASIRGQTISVIDLAMAIGKKAATKTGHHYVIVTEYNRSVQGFLVSGVDRIINMNWEDIKPPPEGMGPDCYLTAITRYEEEFIEIIDVERVLANVTNSYTDLPKNLIESSSNLSLKDRFILIVDDSRVARTQIMRPLKQMGIEYVTATNGCEGLELLKQWAANEPRKLKQLLMVISDVEMPEMDGYTLTTEIRKDPQLKDLFVILHTSLSGVFNQSMVQKVGADHFIAKYNADSLSRFILDYIASLQMSEQ